MKKLDLVILKNSCKYIQLDRNDSVALYAQYFPEITEPIQYEVMKVVISKETTFPSGVVVPEHEVFPSNNAFGRTAWTFKTLEEARTRYDKLSKIGEEKKLCLLDTM